jgi:hypothetical protein
VLFFFETNNPPTIITIMEKVNTTQITYNFKPSKADIIQRLLDEKHITVEEAMTLMASDGGFMPTPPYTPPTPSFPQYPPVTPWITYCQTHTGTVSASNPNLTT